MSDPQRPNVEPGEPQPETTTNQAQQQPAHIESPAAVTPVPEDDELERVTADLRTLQAKHGGRRLRPTQVALIVVAALIVGGLIAPLLLLGDKAPAASPVTTVDADDAAVTALQVYARTLDGAPATNAEQDDIDTYVHVATTTTGDTVASARATNGTCYVLTIPAVADTTTPAPAISVGAHTDCL